MSEKKWKALDDCDTKGNQADVMQEAEQVVSTKQQSFEWIIIRDSEGVEVHTTDTQVAVSLQAALQVAIAIVISVTIGDTDKGNAVVQELSQFIKTKQRNSQKNGYPGFKVRESHNNRYSSSSEHPSITSDPCGYRC